jgi:hypothetical protein
MLTIDVTESNLLYSFPVGTYSVGYEISSDNKTLTLDPTGSPMAFTRK